MANNISKLKKKITYKILKKYYKSLKNVFAKWIIDN